MYYIKLKKNENDESDVFYEYINVMINIKLQN